tara:strand:- start:16900 stop:19281 length:2382 start_codon:yes stop_codon:yes gene_type:complete
MTNKNVIPFSELGINDVESVGGKNASLGEMINHLTKLGVQVPNGFATTADAYRTFLEQSGLNQKIYDALDALDVDDVNRLAEVGADIRQAIVDTPFTPEFEADIRTAFSAMEASGANVVAVRSSATAEDLPDASFAGQQETFLNIKGFDNVLVAIKHVFASLFNDRAIAYRVHQNFDHKHVALSAGIQRMVRSETGASGVIFTLDTESGFNDVVFITSSYGLGEMVVQGAVNPDEFYVHKPTLAKDKFAVLQRNIGSKLIKMIYTDNQSHDKSVVEVPVDVAEQQRFSITDEEVQNLARQAMIIEKHYGRPMDIEWAKDGDTNELFIVQARPETVQSRQSSQVMERYQLEQKSNVVVEGRSIGQRIGQGKARVLRDISQMDKVQPGDVLVTDMTDPDWEPIMKRASAIVTNRGGRTCHAAIIARELGVPAVVGCGDATRMINDGDDVTVSCCEGDTGFVYEGLLKYERKEIHIDNMPDVPFKIMMNVGNPERTFSFSRIPNHGVGLARLEFIISNSIGIHPKALLNFDSLAADMKAQVQAKISAYVSPKEFYIEKIRESVSTIAAAFYPKKVIVRMSDFKSNEYANLLGGDIYEPDEENPMLGFRGASRYVSDNFKDCFALECEAMKRVRNDMGLTNVEIMIPFVRTVEEGKAVLQVLADNDLRQGENDLRVIMMCELPSNAVLADEFLKHFDGFSIGSNDMTQLTLGLDRDSSLVADKFDERNPAVKAMLKMAIDAGKRHNKYVGICGQGPSDHPDLAEWLVEQGIESISLNPDTVVETWLYIAKHLAKVTA